ncbi:MAG: hypothetical protein NXI32_25600, partial [bacterium]|nr:hypothetical protein [bacterium]
MKRLCGYLTLLLGGVLLNSPTSEAGVVVDLFPSQTEITLTGSPQSFSIDVRIAADQGTQSFKAYGLPVDLGPPAGTDTPLGWAVTNISALFDFPVSNFFQSNPNPAEGDLLAEGGTLSTNASDAVQLTTAPLALFRFTVEL